MKRIEPCLWALITATTLSIGSVGHAADVELLQSTIVDNNALNFSSSAATFNRNINGRTYQRFPMATFKGYQYAAYYDDNRHVCVGRRKLPSGAWNVVRFTDYSITSSDSHNVVAIGICEQDGTIHLAFDHHKHPLNYRVSVIGAASDPESVTWSTSLFGPVTSSLGSVGSITDLTYPSFFNAPNGNLMLYYRFGGSGSGDGMIQEYNGTTHDWTTGLGKFISRSGTYNGVLSQNSTSRNPYINGISYAGNRLHATWGWRESAGGAQYNHDLCYAYSDDDGRTWYNNAGTLIGTTGSSFITLNSPGLIVASIPQNIGLSNQYTHYAFPDGSCHVMVVHNGSYQHYWRDAAGNWSQGTLLFSGSRPKLTGDDDGNLFLVYVSGGQPRIAKGVPNGGQTAWTWSSVYTQSGTTEGGEGQLDYSRWDTERVLSRYGQESPSGTGEVPSPLHVFDYTVSNKASQPDPAHGALHVSTNPVLAWAAGIAGNTHRIYFGTDAGAVAAATTASPEYMGEQAGTSYTPAGPLAAGTTYYWRIDEVEIGGSAHLGLVWSFMTDIVLPLVIHQDVDFGEWNTASTWNPDSTPLAGHDYVSAFNLNVSDAAPVFAGDSLTMDTGGSLRLRDSANTFVVNNLIMNGGRIYAATGNNITFALDGNISVPVDTQFQGYWNASGPRNLQILSKISGSANITSFASDNNSTHTLSVENAANDFAGTWICQNGYVDFTSAGAVGAADIQVLDNGKLSIPGNWNANASLTVADAATASVDFGIYDWAVTNLVFGSSSIPLGQYTAAQLNAFGVHAVFTGSGTITVSDGSVPQLPEVIAGWDVWDSGTAPNANVVAANVSGSAVTVSDDPTRPWHTTDERGASDDGTWGTFAGPPVADTSVADTNNQNLELPNAVTGGTITFNISNNGTDDIVLDAFHADLLAFRFKAARTYTVSVLSGGGITPGTVYTSGPQEIFTTNGTPPDHDSHDDVDHSLAGLADRTLAAGESVEFQLAFSGGAGDGSGGHDLWVDNVAVSGTIDGGGPVNQPPAFTSDPVVEANGDEGVAYSGTIADNASDPETDPMTFSKTFGPAWLSVAANGDLSGTPGAADVGLNSFTVQVDATGGSDTATLEITVIAAPVNQPPAFTLDPFSKANATEDAAYSGSIAGDASDPESDPMTFSKVSGPAWLSVAANGTLSGTPANGDVGLNAFTVQVDAIGGSDTATLNITVDNTNDAPTWNSDPVNEIAATEDSAYSSTLANDATDVDAGATLTFSKVSGPAWLSVAANGTLSGTPVNGDVGPNSWTVSVSDGIAAAAQANLNITVANVNDDPVFTADPISRPNATADAAYSDTLAGSATDEDTGDTLSYSKVNGPAWLSVAADGTLSGTPGTVDIGSNSWTVSVSDGNGGSDLATLEITVDTAPVSGLKLVNGVLSNVGSSWQTVNLPQSYNSMVVVATVVLNSTADPVAVTRVQNASGSSFDLMVQNPAGAALSGHTVHYMVVEEGAYSVAVDGVTMEAVKYTSTVTDRKSSWNGESRAYANSYTSPVVLGQVMSANDPNWSVFWCSNGSRTTPPSTSALYTGKHVGEDPVTSRANETVGYIVIESGSGTMSGFDYVAALGADTVSGVDNSPPYSYAISLADAQVAITTMAAMDGNDGGHARLYGSTPVSDTSIDLVVDEDTLNGTERSHTTEQIGYVVFAGTPDTTPPAAPAGLAAVDAIGAVDLDWADNTEPDLASYTVYRSTTSGSGYTAIATGVVNSDYSDSAVTDGVTYYYVVTAVDASSNESAQSAEVSGTPIDGTPPAAPTGFGAVDNIASVDLDWADNAEPDLASYSVYRSTTSGSGYAAIATGLVASAYTDNAVVEHVTYYYVVTAFDTIGNESALSAEVSGSPLDVTPPAAPTGLTAQDGIGEVALDWADNAESDLAGYTVYRSTTSGGGYAAVATGVAASDYVDTSVVNHTTYYYVVTANDGSGNASALSAEASATPGFVFSMADSDVAVQGTVSGTLADADVNDDQYQTITEVVSGSTSALEHKWIFTVVPAELVTFYVEAHHSVNSEGDDMIFAFSTDDVNYTDMLTVTKTADGNTAQYFVLPGGTSGTVYIRVRDADRSNGNTQLDSVSVDAVFIVSEESTVAPGAASSPSPADGAMDVAVNVLLDWTAGMMAASHDVYFGTSPSPAFQGNQASTGFNPGTLAAGTTYYWAVDEVNNSGTTAGPLWSFTTGAAVNQPPVFTFDPFSTANATENAAYSDTIAGSATDGDNDPLTYSKVAGPAWLSVASDGSLSGTPSAGDVGLNSFTVDVSDGNGGTDSATLEITVDPAQAGWTDLVSEDFESGFGAFVDGGSDARLTTINALGAQNVELRDDTSTSHTQLANSLDLSGYSELRIAFSYVVSSFEGSEDFWVRFSADGGSSWTTIKAYVNNVDFVDDGTRYDPELIIDNGSYTFNSNVKIRFQCDASGNGDDVYIDNVVISAR